MVKVAHNSKRFRGLSLAETVIGLFLISAAVLSIFNLYTAALRYGTRAQERVLAVTLAQAKMDELRGWAQQPATPGHNWDDWSGQTGVSTNPEFPGYQVEVTEQLVVLDSPNSRFEQAFAAADRIQARNVRRVTVTVTWRNGQTSITSLLAQPGLEWGSPAMQITPTGSVPDPVPADTDIDFTVEAFDADNRPINDLTYTWYVRPVTGNGSIAQSRSGETATFGNRVQLPDGMHTATGGRVTVVVRAKLRGVERTAEYDLNLTAAVSPW